LLVQQAVTSAHWAMYTGRGCHPNLHAEHAAGLVAQEH